MIEGTYSWQPMEPDGTGRHICGSGIYVAPVPSSSATTSSGHSSSSWSISTLEQPLTYPTICWWCGAPVFFHTNGFGDCVLFDRLGWPWEVHGCWEKYRTEQHDSLRKLEETLTKEGYNGAFYEPSGEEVAAPKRISSKTSFISVVGYVADNHALYNEPTEYSLSLGGRAESPVWVKFEVGNTEGKLYPFLLPRSIANDIDDYSMVRISGRWVKWKDTWFLIATRLILTEYPSGNKTRKKVAKLERVLRCYYCGRRILRQKQWGFDKALRMECSGCSEMRGNLNPSQFLRLIRRIAFRHNEA